MFSNKIVAQEESPAPSARNLGVVFDSALNFKSRILYCNSVLFNVTEKEISKLQGVAKVVAKSLRFCHITPLLKSLHWLPARYRNKFKFCSPTYQALASEQPVYIRNMIQLSR